jgi:hypothetical protein
MRTQTPPYPLLYTCAPQKIAFGVAGFRDNKYASLNRACAGNTLMPPGSWAQNYYVAHAECEAPPELLSHGRGRRCTDANRLSNPVSRPTQRREGRECVSHDCGAVRMCACHGLEQGRHTERRYCKPSSGTPIDGYMSCSALALRWVVGQGRIRGERHPVNMNNDSSTSPQPAAPKKQNRRPLIGPRTW